MKVLKKVMTEAKYYAVPDEDDLDGQTEAILNMPAVQPVDVDIDDELGMIDDIETRAGNLGSIYGDEEVGLDDELAPEECEDGECEDGEVYEITSTDPVCPCCGCKLVITDLPSEAETDVDDATGEEEVSAEDGDEDDVEVIEDDGDEGDEDDVEVIEDDEESEDDDEDEE
jgi:Uncharacterized conserved protein